MAVRTVEITAIFRKIQVMALTELIAVNKFILRAVALNSIVNSTVTAVKV
jgi:hypothetical protein